MRLVLAVLCLSTLSLGLAAADAKSDANAAYAAQNWSDAARLYSSLVKTFPDDGQAWYRLGTARHQLGSLDEAIAAYLRAVELKFAPSFTYYNLAGAYARKSDSAKAYAALESAIAAGFRDDTSLATDTDFASIKSEPRFRELQEQVAKLAHPCRTNEYRALDFWVGDWNVRDSRAGHAVGSSSIQRILDDCVVLENWSGARGGNGKSFNTIDRTTSKWRQTWTDSSGQIFDFTGEPSADRMIFQREARTPDGKPLLIRMTLAKLPDGSVRQLSEQSLDEGKNWSVGYDFTYERR